ncbi:MAG: DUF87 domain-containing protein [Patescibacteria group bacterium]
MTAHTLLEIRTSKQAEHKNETATQFFSALPQIKKSIFHKLLKRDETISFELLVWNQSIYFMAYLPSRLSEYISGLLQSSYPEVLITPLELDPILSFSFDPEKNDNFIDQQSKHLKLGELRLKSPSYLPLKSYSDFTDVDPLATILSTLSKSQQFDKIAIQIVIAPDNESWKRRGQNILNSETAHPQKDLIAKKLANRSLQANIRLVVSSSSPTRSELLLETVATGFSSITQSEGNSLKLVKPIFKKRFLKAFHKRQANKLTTQHFSLEELATIFHLPNQQLSHIPNIAWGKNLLGEAPENLPIVRRGMDPQLKKTINPFAETTFKNDKFIYGLKREDRRRHFYVIGKTGTGKSTLLANMAINDLKNDEGLCVIDPHGDLVEILLDYIPSRRINDVVYFDPTDVDKTVKINLFEGQNIEHRELIASGIVSVFKKLYGYSWGPRLEHILRNALLTLLKTETSRMSDIIELLTNNKFRKKIVENLDDEILKSFWVNEFGKMQDRQRNEAVAPILNKVGQFVSSPLVRNVVNAQKSSFSIENIMNDGKILLVNLSQGKLGEDNATLLGAMLITKIQLAAMGRVNIPEEKRRDFYLYVDEFQNFATDSFIKILSEARKYRLNLTLANQYIAQIPEEVQKAIFGNCGSIASFVMGAEDSAAFEREYGGKYTKEDLVSLNRYQIINKISIDNIISQPFPANTIGLAKSKNQNKEKVIKVSRERYAKKRN